MTLKDTLRNMILLYPNMYNALKVYNHLFCVIGNGYDWVDGELVDKSEKQRRVFRSDAVEHIIKDVLNESSVENDIEDVKSILQLNDKEFSEVNILKEYVKSKKKELISDVLMTLLYEVRMKDFNVPSAKNYPESLFLTLREKVDTDYIWTTYPLSDYSAICCIPDDVKDDWLEGAEKMLEFLESHPQNVRECDLERNKEWYEKIHQRISEIKSSRT